VIYVDSNVIYNYLFETPLTKRASILLEEHKGELVTSFSTVEEAVYVVLRKLLSERGIRNRYDAKRHLKTSEGKKLIEDAFAFVLGVVFQYEIQLVEDASSPGIVETYAVKYGLMPRDAQIVATCVLNGIGKIATFDTDFDDVPELSVLR
jgi:predicted nucleic acid-binding protein